MMLNEKGEVVCPNCGEVNPAFGHECPKLPEDPTPWCHICGARVQDDCNCGPLAAND
jgi:hypothetical protein